MTSWVQELLIGRDSHHLAISDGEEREGHKCLNVDQEFMPFSTFSVSIVPPFASVLMR